MNMPNSNMAAGSRSKPVGRHLPLGALESTKFQ
jgi:hypothetical protein